MSGTSNVTMGDRGRLVVPADVRKRRGLTEGTPLVLVDTDDGIVSSPASSFRPGSKTT